MTEPESGPSHHESDGADHDMEEYAGGYIQAHHGYIPAWLLAVYLVLFLWALYYLVVFWGGTGPEQIR